MLLRQFWAAQYPENTLLTLCPYLSHNPMGTVSPDTDVSPWYLGMSGQCYTHWERFCIHPHLYKEKC
jgi:hypothetical protein